MFMSSPAFTPYLYIASILALQNNNIKPNSNLLRQAAVLLAVHLPLQLSLQLLLLPLLAVHLILLVAVLLVALHLLLLAVLSAALLPLQVLGMKNKQ